VGVVGGFWEAVGIPLGGVVLRVVQEWVVRRVTATGLGGGGMRSVWHGPGGLFMGGVGEVFTSSWFGGWFTPGPYLARYYVGRAIHFPFLGVGAPLGRVYFWGSL